VSFSPVGPGLSALDAPLPASFDSNGISIIARNGPIAASVPTRFGLESSPPSSFHPTGSSTIRNLQATAFGEPIRNGNILGSSPSVTSEDAPGSRRIMHSERFAKPRMLSASVGAGSRLPRADLADEDWDEIPTFSEEDLVPNELIHLLTPEQRRRRLSRNAEDESTSFSHRSALSAIGTPGDSSSPKVGSPLGASPSRFGSFFKDQQKGSASEGPNPLGHVGSPLRPSSLNPGASPALRASSRPVSGEFSVSSPPRQASASVLSQQLQRTRISSRASELSDGSAKPQTPNITRSISAGSVGAAPGRLDRTASTSSVSMGRDKIDEEPELFRMDELGDQRSNKRMSGLAGVWGAKNDVGVIGGRRAAGPGAGA